MRQIIEVNGYIEARVDLGSPGRTNAYVEPCPRFMQT